MKDSIRKLVRGFRSKKNLLKRHGGALFSSQPHWSQFGEDIILQAMFDSKENGFYIDVGAYSPTRLSNTYLLYKNGWKGINIEPLPHNFSDLKAKRNRDININCAISDEAGEVSFVVDQAYSGIDSDNFPSAYRRKVRPKIKVKTFPLKSILAEHLPPNQEIDFLDVDCEGHDLTVLMTNDWQKYRPKVILAEMHDDGEIQSYLFEKDYLLYVKSNLTGVFVDKKFVDLSSSNILQLN